MIMAETNDEDQLEAPSNHHPLDIETASGATRNWVKFDDGDQPQPPTPNGDRRTPSPEQFATIDLSSMQQNGGHKQDSSSSGQPSSSLSLPVEAAPPPPSSSTANNGTPAAKPNGFANGDVIVTLYPLNENCAWITPATFKAHLVPEELMAQPLTLTVEDYVSTMSIMLNDFRFYLFITLHKRILAIWISLSVLILLGILFSGARGISIFLAGILWMILNALGIFLVIFIKSRLHRMLEQSVAQVNSIFGRHNIFLGIDDRGHFSCHKISLIFVYFDTRYCIKFLQDMLKNQPSKDRNNQNRNSTAASSSSPPPPPPADLSALTQDIDEEIYITSGSGVLKPASGQTKERQAEKLLYRYSQRWIRAFVRQRMSLSVINPAPVVSSAETSSGTTSATTPVSAQTDIPPRHCRTAKCFCQYIEEHFRYKQQQRQHSLRQLFTTSPFSS